MIAVTSIMAVIGTSKILPMRKGRRADKNGALGSGAATRPNRKVDQIHLIRQRRPLPGRRRGEKSRNRTITPIHGARFDFYPHYLDKKIPIAELSVDVFGHARFSNLRRKIIVRKNCRDAVRCRRVCAGLSFSIVRQKGCCSNSLMATNLKFGPLELAAFLRARLGEKVPRRREARLKPWLRFCLGEGSPGLRASRYRGNGQYAH